MYWILDKDGIPVEVSDPLVWAEFYEKKNRFIAKYERAGYLVSTVFLGIDQRFGCGGPPVLFETMVFDDQRWEKPGDGGNSVASIGAEMECERYSTKDDALIGHERHVKELDRKLDYAEQVAKAFLK